MNTKRIGLVIENREIPLMGVKFGTGENWAQAH